MRIFRSFLPLTYFPLWFTHKVTLAIDKIRTTGRLRVILYHDIPPNHYDIFKQQIEWISKRWRFINVKEFEEIVEGKKDINDDCVLLTFDDGFLSNKIICEKVLNPLGIKALFFIISDYVMLDKTRDDSRNFLSNIYPGTISKDHPRHMLNMDVSDVRYLLKYGHSIGSHTGSHQRLSRISNNAALISEIVDGADNLEKIFGIKVNHFAFPFGDLSSFSKYALVVARQRFPYIHTGMRGENMKSVPSWAIRRDAITTADSFWTVGAFLEGAADHRYRTNLLTYDSWGVCV